MNLANLVRQMLIEIGEDPNRPGLKQTPERYARAMRELTAGYAVDPASVFTVFEEVPVDQMIVVRDIPFSSTCEHHLMPFIGKVHVGYLPTITLYERDGKAVPAYCRVAGLSKFPRLIDVFAKRLQTQERMTNQIADVIETSLKPGGCGVMVVATHCCMECRGVLKSGSRTVTTALRGVFKDEQTTKSEFLQHCKGH